MNPNSGLDPSTHYQYSPWRCPTCHDVSDEPHCCTSCGKILEGKQATAGREDRKQ